MLDRRRRRRPISRRASNKKRTKLSLSSLQNRVRGLDALFALLRVIVLDDGAEERGLLGREGLDLGRHCDWRFLFFPFFSRSLFVGLCRREGFLERRARSSCRSYGSRASRERLERRAEVAAEERERGRSRKELLIFLLLFSFRAFDL